jgi:diguanylate cyclase (GGDEF)-like protein
MPIGQRRHAQGTLRALIISVIVLCLLGSLTTAVFHSMRSTLIEKGRSSGEEQLLTVRRNLYLLLGRQEMVLTLLGQRIEEGLSEESDQGIEELDRYLAYHREAVPSFRFATLAKETIVIDRFPQNGGHEIGFDLRQLSGYDAHIAPLQGTSKTSFDGPIYTEDGTCYLVGRYLLETNGSMWGVLTLHYDFGSFLQEIGVDRLSDAYVYRFTFSHPGGDEVYRWGIGELGNDAISMEASYSFLAWRMELAPKRSWIAYKTPLYLSTILGSLLSLAGSVIAFYVTRRIQRLYVYSNTDSLTGLLNRRAFAAALQRECAKGGSFALAVIDLDNFKVINDSWGHLHGDGALLELVAVLKKVTEPSDLLGRFGGDEFIILLRSCHSAKSIERLYQRLSPLPITLDGVSVQLACSMGVAIAPDDGSDGDALMQIADHRLYRAKLEGKGRVIAHSWFERSKKI